jgi:hypothetical protein
MRTGLAPQRDTLSTVAPRDGAGDRSMPDEYRLQDGPASSMVDAGRLPMAVGAVATTASVDPIATATLPVVSRGVPVQRHGAAPTLMSAGSTAPTTVIRRVTLPRALSVQHRPDSSFASHTVSTPGRPPRPSVVTVAEASAPRGSSAVTMLQRSEAPVGPALHDAVEVGRLTASERTAPLGVASVDTVRPSRARSLVPPGTGALLEVVRRSAQPLTSASEQPSRSTPMAPQLGVDPIAVAPRASRRGAQQPQPTAEVTTPTDVVDGSTTDAMVGATRRARPAEQVADQFMTALSETIRRRPAPLPTTFRPMADAIAGPRPVMLSTDSASRRALRSVGKVAATTGDTIHLDDRAIPAARLAEVMAHELTHIAHPSPTPRFFDDIDDSPEERRAERIAKVMARSPLAPAASVAAPPGRDLDRTIRRKATTTRTATSAPTGGASSAGGVTAEQLAAQFSGSATSTRPSASDVIRRTPAPAATGPNVIRRALESPEPNAHAHESVVESTSEDFLDAFRQHLPTIMNLIEDRMIIELERRGGRTWGSL